MSLFKGFAFLFLMEVGQKVRLVLRNNFHYSGEVLSINENIITIKDKFGVVVTINLNEIIVLEEIEDG